LFFSSSLFPLGSNNTGHICFVIYFIVEPETLSFIWIFLFKLFIVWCFLLPLPPRRPGDRSSQPRLLLQLHTPTHAHTCRSRAPNKEAACGWLMQYGNQESDGSPSSKVHEPCICMHEAKLDRSICIQLSSLALHIRTHEKLSRSLTGPHKNPTTPNHSHRPTISENFLLF
jgi:hypothetical protein